jgi:hypothetical protein
MQKIIATTTATAKVVATNRIGFDVMFFRASLNICYPIFAFLIFLSATARSDHQADNLAELRREFFLCLNR